MKKFEKENVAILGVSADSVKAQANFKAKYKLNFPLLSDPEFKVIEAYGARRMKKFLGKSFLGIVRSSFLIGTDRSEEHTSELQSRLHLVCRLLLEKKKNKQSFITN